MTPELSSTAVGQVPRVGVLLSVHGEQLTAQPEFRESPYPVRWGRRIGHLWNAFDVSTFEVQLQFALVTHGRGSVDRIRL